jgi:hypothetical protein
MANTVLTPDIIAKEAVMILENECVMGGLVHRGYEEEFDSVNGYKPGSTIRIARPTDFTVRDGQTATIQDTVEGSLNFSVDKFKGVDFAFTSTELTLSIGELSQRVIKPAMIQIANQIDRDVMALYDDVWNWVGTPGQVVNSFSDFKEAPKRLDNGAVPQDRRSGVLSPDDHWDLAGSATALYMQQIAQEAYRKGKIGDLGGVDTYMSQNVPTLTVGTRSNATVPLVNGSQSTTWASTKTTGTMSLATDGWGTTTTIKAGEVFTIAGVFAVNPVTKATLSYLQPFVVKADTASTGLGGGTATIIISPPIITTGAFQTVSAAPADNATITIMGTASTVYTQNMVFHKNAFGLVVAPLVKPPGAVDVSRKSYKGFSVRVIPYYNGSNDISSWRLDVLYGVQTLDARLATRLSGTA